jgi:DHA1 family inner membrane transport protein
MFMGLTIANIGGACGNLAGRNDRLADVVPGDGGAGRDGDGGLFFSLPKGSAGERPDVRKELSVLMRPQVLSALLTTVLGAGAMFTLYTYISPVLHDITHAAASLLPRCWC